jgi:hypothetical protein
LSISLRLWPRSPPSRSTIQSSASGSARPAGAGGAFDQGLERSLVVHVAGQGRQAVGLGERAQARARRGLPPSMTISASPAAASAGLGAVVDSSPPASPDHRRPPISDIAPNSSAAAPESPFSASPAMSTTRNGSEVLARPGKRHRRSAIRPSSLP